MTLLVLFQGVSQSSVPDAWRLIYVKKRGFTILASAVRTQYREINIRRRGHTVNVRLPKRSDTALTVVNNDDTYIERNGDIYIDRAGDTYIAHNTTSVYPREISVRKRNFTIRGKVTNG